MLELQDVWKPFESDIHFSVRRAAKALGVSNGHAAKALNEFIEHGFIKCVDESDWYNGKARVWCLTWLSVNKKEPDNEWMKWSEN